MNICFDLYVIWSEFDSEFFGVQIGGQQMVVSCMKVFYF
jgi:hypothetical protein